MSPRLDSEYNDADQSTGLMLWRVTNAWQAAQRAALKPFGLTHVQFVLLASLTWLQADEAVTQQRLADHARTDPMMTSQILRALERLGLIRRDQHPTDRRAKELTVTDSGRDLANQANRAVEQCDVEFFSALAHRQAEFTAMLGQLTR